MKILACVYNEIDFDGRVQRASEALADIGEVAVVSLDSGRDYRSLRFKSIVVKRARMLRSAAVSHLKAWLMLCVYALREKPDVLHAHDCFMAFPGWLAARLSGASLAYDAHELVIPEPGIEMTLRDRLWYVLERWAIVRADLVIAANEERAAIMVNHYHLSSAPVVIQNIPPAPSGQAPSTGEGLAAVQRKRATDRLVVYQGDVDVRRGIGRFVEAFTYLPPDFRLIIIGGGPSCSELAAYARSNNIEDRVAFVGKIARDSLAGVMSECDLGIVTYSFQGLDSILCASNKVYEYAQAGLPMVLTNQAPLKRIVDEWTIGALVGPHDSAADIAAAILHVVSNRKQLAMNARAFAAANDWEREAVNLRQAIASLAKPVAPSGDAR